MLNRLNIYFWLNPNFEYFIPRKLSIHINFYHNYQLWIRPWHTKILPKLLLIFALNITSNSRSSKINNFDQSNHLPSTEVQQSTRRLNPKRVIREKSCEEPHPLDPSSRRNSLVQIISSSARTRHVRVSGKHPWSLIILLILPGPHPLRDDPVPGT